MLLSRSEPKPNPQHSIRATRFHRPLLCPSCRPCPLLVKALLQSSSLALWALPKSGFGALGTGKDKSGPGSPMPLQTHRPAARRATPAEQHRLPHACSLSKSSYFWKEKKARKEGAAAGPQAGTAQGQAGGRAPPWTLPAPPCSPASAMALAGPPRKRNLGMIPPEEPKTQPLPVLGRRRARQVQSEPGLREPRAMARLGDAPVPGAWRVGAGAAGASPQRQVLQRGTGLPW